jgi:hypothetical protein
MKIVEEARLKVHLRRVSGVTLMEVLVASTIAMMLMTVMWSLFSSGMKQFFLTQQHLEALQVSQMALEYIENDLHAMIVLDKDTPTLLDDMTPRNTVTFHASRGDQASGGLYMGAKIVYGLSSIEGTPYSYFVRNGRIMYNMPLKKLLFEPIKIAGLDGIDRYFLRTTVIAMDSNMKSEYVLVGLTALDMLCLRKRNPHWQKIQLPYVRIE